MNKKSKSTLEKLNQELRFKNFSDNTIKVYLHYAEIFLSSFNKDVYHISSKEACVYLKSKKYTSVSQQNQFISAVKSLYKFVVKKKLKVDVERPRKEKSLPKIIDREFILNKCDDISNLKHKSIILLGYSVGLRVSEVVNLRISDIDSDRMIIVVRQSKGIKDRIVPLTQSILDLLRMYFKKYKPIEYLFNGQFSLKYSASSCNKIVKRYLGEKYHFHLLRHSCFTNLTDQGVDLRVIQKLAGHSSSKTTEIYTHVSNGVLKNLPLAV